ncbi:BTB/POZ domain-containing protein 18 [Heterocephalus glaber]|uniref:BTB/POZ domain-containing protein 18 n=1 Tax=Heterocephalus glaber TaxID=10181 RepID=A0AAX6S604_HETGA|nr:BTB/POZ domain-containing protein 18 [Heterocephalus glaber]
MVEGPRPMGAGFSLVLAWMGPKGRGGARGSTACSLPLRAGPCVGHVWDTGVWLPPGEAVPAHRCILSACSPFFTERLEQESPVQGRKVVLELGGLKIRTLRKLVDFLYTSEMEVSREEAQDLLSAARQLRVSELESLQLEGGKLVKAPLGRRLNRECLQPSALPISARVVAPGCHHRPPLPGTRPPCPPGLARSLKLGREEGPPEESAPPSTSRAGTLGPVRGPAPSPARLSPPADQQLLPRKIRLSRPRPPPSGGTAGGPSSVPTAPGRRLWRQRMNRGAVEDRQEPGRTSPLQSTPSPSAPCRKRSPEARAPPPEPAEEGQVGRVKLRKVVNGTRWEVVQEPPPPLRIPDRGDGEAPPGAPLSPASGQEEAPGRLELYQDSPEGNGMLDVMLAGGHSPDQPGAGRAFGSSPELPGKEPMLSSNRGEPCAFAGALRGPRHAGASSAKAASELEDILDLMLCGRDLGPPEGSPESPGPEGCRTPSYHLAGAGGAWMEEGAWCLPDLELWSRELSGLDEEPAGQSQAPPGDGDALPVGGAWTPDLEAPASRSPELGEKPSTPGSGWTERGLDEHPAALEELCPAPGTGPGPPTASSEDEEIDVDWTAEAALVPAGVPSVWPDPSSESDTELDVLT